MSLRLAGALFAPAAIALAAVSLAGATRPGPSDTASCRIVAEPPFLYSVVIPVSSVQCTSSQRRLRIETQLTRDGVVAAAARRSCTDASACWLTVDASAPDEPGNQTWCTVTRDYAGTSYLGEARSCEVDDF
jgi:hypothetical protein